MSQLRKIKTLIVLGLIPVLIFVGVYFFKNKSYYLISTLVLLCLITPFFLEYSTEKNCTKKIVLIASLAAIATAGRIVFYMIPNFKPVLAIVIISSVIIGPYEGFMVGALTAFVSNFYFGQGPWTVWQMFCFGLVGFVAGYLFQKIKISRIALCTYGLLSAVLIYGGIINFGSIAMYSAVITKESLIATYIAGFPFDLIHGISTFIFLFLIYKPFTDKLTRIKVKYDINNG